jgi:hypothetical protein
MQKEEVSSAENSMQCEQVEKQEELQPETEPKKKRKRSHFTPLCSKEDVADR